MGRRTYVEAARLADELLRAGWPVIVDGSFSHVAERAQARAVAERHGLPFAVLWCDAPGEVLLERLRRRGEDRHEVPAGRVELLAEHRARYESPAHEPGVIRLNTSGEAEGAVERITTAIDFQVDNRHSITSARLMTTPSGSRSSQ